MAIGFIPNRRAGSKVDYDVENQKTDFLLCFGFRDCHIGIGYGFRCLRLLQLEHGLYGGWNWDWFTVD